MEWMANLTECATYLIYIYNSLFVVPTGGGFPWPIPSAFGARAEPQPESESQFYAKALLTDGDRAAASLGCSVYPGTAVPVPVGYNFARFR